jgi:hypothetical protein
MLAACRLEQEHTKNALTAANHKTLGNPENKTVAKTPEAASAKQQRFSVKNKRS